MRCSSPRSRWRSRRKVNSTGCAPSTRPSCRPSRTTLSWSPSRSTTSTSPPSSACSPSRAASMSFTTGRGSSRTKSGRSATRSSLNLAEGYVDEFAVGGPLAQALEPRFNVRKAGPLYRDSHPALHFAADWDVAHREGAAGHILLTGQVLLEHRQQLRRLLAAGLDRLHVALLGRRADQSPEHIAHGALEGERPVHPALGVGTRLQVGRIEPAGCVLRA